MEGDWRSQMDQDVSWRGLWQSFAVVAIFLSLDWILSHCFPTHSMLVGKTLAIIYFVTQGFLRDRGVGSLLFLLVLGGQAVQSEYHAEHALLRRLLGITIIVCAPVLGYLFSRLLRRLTGNKVL